MTKATFELAGLLAIALLNAACRQPRQPEFDYLGQHTPGMTPEIFAPDIISTDDREHNCVTFSPDGAEIYFTRQYGERHDILFMKRVEGKWSDPRPVPFTSDFLDDGASFSPDGNRLYFGSRRPILGNGEDKTDTDIWYVDRVADGWSEPVHLGAPINTEHNDGFPFITRDGTMYFHSDRDTGPKNMEIYRSRNNNGRFGEPERLGPPINTELYDAAPNVAPDGSFMTYFHADLNDIPKVGLRMSCRRKDGGWSEPIDLVGKLGLGATDLLMAKLSPDGKYLFILDQGDVYWVDAKVVDVCGDTG